MNAPVGSPTLKNMKTVVGLAVEPFHVCRADQYTVGCLVAMAVICMGRTILENAGHIFNVNKPLYEAPGVGEGRWVLMIRSIIVFRFILSI